MSINQLVQPPLWAPKIIYSLAKEIYHYVGEDIVIYETIDSYGAIMWPAVSMHRALNFIHSQVLVIRH